MIKDINTYTIENDKDELLTSVEAAAYLGYKPITLARWRKVDPECKRYPYFIRRGKRGPRTVLYSKSVLDVWNNKDYKDLSNSIDNLVDIINKQKIALQELDDMKKKLTENEKESNNFKEYENYKS
jgi:hypothetical protein